MADLAVRARVHGARQHGSGLAQQGLSRRQLAGPDAGITNGFPDGTFRPGETVTRQSTAAFIFRVFLRGA